MIYEFITYIHLIGFALGFGGAMFSDVLFLKSIKDLKITDKEFEFIQVGGRLVILGISILFISGIGLILLDTGILQTPKFIAKMFIVLLIALNGIVFHIVHLPYLHTHINLPFHLAESFEKRSHFLTISGAISIVSWFSAALLGSLRTLPLVLPEILGIYLIILICSIFFAVILNKYIFQR